MISKEFQEYIIDSFAGQQGQKYPCSNQIVANMIICQDIDDKVFNFLKERNFTVLSKSKEKIVGEMDNEKWQVIRWNDGMRGYRLYQGVIDTRLSEKIVEQTILPCMALYNRKVEFF